jgi:PAS domain S-box-containing protein
MRGRGLAAGPASMHLARPLARATVDASLPFGQPVRIRTKDSVPRTGNWCAAGHVRPRRSGNFFLAASRDGRTGLDPFPDPRQERMTMAATADAAPRVDAPSAAELDPRHAGDLERLTRLAARVFKAPAAIVTTRRGEGERVLLGAGMRKPLVPGHPLALERLTGRRHIPARAGAVVAVRDARRSHLPGAAGLAEAGLVACLACTLPDSRGRARGTLVVLDWVPRRWLREERAVLGELAVLAGRELERLDAVRERELVEAALARARASLSGAEEARGPALPLRVGQFTAEDGRITWTNPELAHIAGYTAEEMTTMETPEDLVLDGVDRVRLLGQLGGPAPLADSVQLCTEMRRRDASTGRVEVSLSRVELGERFLVVGAVQDLDYAEYDAEALRAEAARYRRAFEDDLCGVVIAAPDFRIAACNTEFARILGLPSPESAVGLELARLEAEPGALAARVERLRGGHPCGPEELELVRRDGTSAYVVARLVATPGPGGEVPEYRGYLVDVTARALREKALRQTEERLRLLELATNDVTWEWDLGTGRTTWNGAGPRRFRYAPQEVRPTLEWQVERIHGDDRERVMAGLQGAVAGIGDSWADEYRFLRGDGTYATVHNRAYVVRNVRGEPVRVIGWMVDVTERKRTEESQRFLARASAMLDATLDVGVTSANLARVCIPALADFCALDLVEENGDVRRAAVAHGRAARERLLNPGSCIPAGTRDPEHPILAAAASGEPVLHTDGDAAALAGLDRALGEGNSRRLGVHSYMVVPIRAHERVVAVMLLGLSQTGRRYDAMDLLVAKDLAVRAALALDNARLYETAQHALRARQEVLGVVSHDLRGPLSTLVTTAVLLSETGRERREETRKWLDIIRRAADQMNQLIGDLLDVSQIEAGRFAVQLAPHSLKALLSQTCEQWGALAAAGGLRLECDVEAGLPPVECDERQMARVLANLLGNALKFTPRGGSVRLQAAAQGQEVRISVADTGPGLAPGQIERVFDRFWKAHDVDRRGAGLGLAIARGIVDAHHGRIGVDSVEGQGSTFWLTLPTRGASRDGGRAPQAPLDGGSPPPPSLPLVLPRGDGAAN